MQGCEEIKLIAPQITSIQICSAVIGVPSGPFVVLCWLFNE
jgi:hypothetical protein